MTVSPTAVPRHRDLVQISLLYLPLNIFWTAMLSQLLPERIEAFAGAQKGDAIAVVGAVGAFVAAVSMFLVGPLSDRTVHPRGRRFPWIVWGFVIGTLGALFFSLATSLLGLLVAFILARMGFAMAISAYEAILPDRIPRNFQSRASGWNEAFDVLGQVFGLLFTALMVRGAINRLFRLHLAPIGESHLAVGVICGGCIIALLGILCLNLPWISGPPLPPEEARPVGEVIRSALAWRPSDSPDFMWLYLSRCILNIGSYIGIEFLRYYVQEALPLKGTDLAHEVMMIGLYVTAGGVLGALLGGGLGDFLSKRTLLFVFCSFAAIAACGFCLTHSLAQARAIGFCFGIGFSAINAVDWAFAVGLIPAGHEARYLSFFHTSYYWPQIVVMGVGGLIGQCLGYRALFWMIPIALTLSMLILTRVRDSVSPSWNPQ